MGSPQRTALVTGAGIRVGRALALRLAREGFSIAAHYNRSAEQIDSLVETIETEGGRARAFQADLSQDAAAEDLADRVLAGCGPVALLVNSASLWVRTPPATLTAQTIDTLLAVNLRSPLLLSVRFGEAMRKSGKGQIISILDWSIDRPYGDYIPYGIAKAGLAAATRGLARALAPGVRVNAVAPGPVLLQDTASPEKREAIRRAVPMGRIGEPSDVEEAVVYLIGARYVTGTILTVDGGRSL